MHCGKSNILLWTSEYPEGSIHEGYRPIPRFQNKMFRFPTMPSNVIYHYVYTAYLRVTDIDIQIQTVFALRKSLSIGIIVLWAYIPHVSCVIQAIPFSLWYRWPQSVWASWWFNKRYTLEYIDIFAQAQIVIFKVNSFPQQVSLLNGDNWLRYSLWNDKNYQEHLICTKHHFKHLYWSTAQTVNEITQHDVDVP